MVPLWFNKTYHLHQSENFEGFLAAIGINYFLRKIIMASHFAYKLTALDNNEFVLSEQTSFVNMDLKFRPGEVFVSVKPNGDKIETVIEFESENVLIHKQLTKYPGMVRRIFKEDEMIMICTSESGVIGKRWFKVK
uniref:CSON009019 protein n=1 Tax=Culicoides sonorensis TaxID=179676 RepID=A0A336KE25_CULSO